MSDDNWSMRNVWSDDNTYMMTINGNGQYLLQTLVTDKLFEVLDIFFT